MTRSHDLMTINWKVWALVGIIVVMALVIFGYSQFGRKAPQAPVTEEVPQEPVADEVPQGPVGAPEQKLPGAVTEPTTGNIDDAVNVILEDALGDQALFDDLEKEAALVDYDSQAISDFGKTYNENEF